MSIAKYPTLKRSHVVTAINIEDIKHEEILPSYLVRIALNTLANQLTLQGKITTSGTNPIDQAFTTSNLPQSIPSGFLEIPITAANTFCITIDENRHRTTVQLLGNFPGEVSITLPLPELFGKILNALLISLGNHRGKRTLNITSQLSRDRCFPLLNAKPMRNIFANGLVGSVEEAQ